MNVGKDYKEACPYKMVIGVVLKELSVVVIDILRVLMMFYGVIMTLWE